MGVESEKNLPMKNYSVGMTLVGEAKEGEGKRKDSFFTLSKNQVEDERYHQGEGGKEQKLGCRKRVVQGGV